MPRFAYILALPLVLGSSSAVAQEQQPTGRVYVAYHQVSYGDLLEWMDLYNQHSVPVLDALVEEGVLTGYGAWMHHTGGEYNIRMGFRAGPNADFGPFWNQYLARLAARDAEAFERGSRMITAHHDEIWNIDQTNVPDGAGARYFYDAQFQVNFADLGAWGEMWHDTFGPTMERAVSEGLIVGWVEESHNTGGRFNWKVIMLVNEWDALDEFNAMIFEAAPLDHPIWNMFSAHMDELWEALPSPSGN